MITTQADDHQRFETERCSMCAGKLWPPFLAWAGPGDGIFLCGDCCVRWRDGLSADMIQCAAITELQRLGRLHGHTLVRTTTQELERQVEERERQGREIMRKMRVVE